MVVNGILSMLWTNDAEPSRWAINKANEMGIIVNEIKREWEWKENAAVLLVPHES